GSSACKKEFVCHFSERETGRECRHRKNGWASQHPSQGLCEFEIGYRQGRNCIHGPGQLQVRQHAIYYSDQITYLNPPHVLVAGSDLASHSQIEWRKHILQRTARKAQHDAATKERDAHPAGSCRGGGTFPVPTQLGEEAGTW